MSKREEIAPHGDKRYIRRDEKGGIKSWVEERASLSADAAMRPSTTPAGVRATRHQGGSGRGRVVGR